MGSVLSRLCVVTQGRPVGWVGPVVRSWTDCAGNAVRWQKIILKRSVFGVAELCATTRPINKETSTNTCKFLKLNGHSEERLLKVATVLRSQNWTGTADESALLAQARS